MKYPLHQENIANLFVKTREKTDAICLPLAIEDYGVQPISDVSPPKWHLAHTTWFFEQFILTEYLEGYTLFSKEFAFLFNSYYNTIGERVKREQRGFLSRPTVAEVHAYRAYINSHMQQLFSGTLPQEVLEIIEIGIHHEQQHQELLVYDIKYILGTQPLHPIYADAFIPKAMEADKMWHKIPSGVYPIGAADHSFSFDNERPIHKVHLNAYEINNALVTNGEYLEFIEDGGYNNHSLWHAEGWDFINKNNCKAPLYWDKKDNQWQTYQLNGLQTIDWERPVMHVSFFEAAAFAEWAGKRLPTEFEWERASELFSWGELWEWTSSAYLPYPEFTKATGALGEYNGKFMLNQNVLRGGSVATPHQHTRSTYRNFFHASSRWLFSGFRLAKN